MISVIAINSKLLLHYHFIQDFLHSYFLFYTNIHIFIKKYINFLILSFYINEIL